MPGAAKVIYCFEKVLCLPTCRTSTITVTITSTSAMTMTITFTAVIATIYCKYCLLSLSR